MALIEGSLKEEVYMGQRDEWLINGWDADQWQIYADEHESDEAYAIVRFLRNYQGE